MGVWGTKLYDNDSACDIKEIYVDKLKKGSTNEEVTQYLIETNRDIMGDSSEEPLFWFALADLQWDYGRLLPKVKEKALYFLDQDGDLELWREEGTKLEKEWMKTREKLRKKLETEQPAEKKISKYRLYHCEWKMGDVFAYRFVGKESKNSGFYGKYIVFRKVSECNSWRGDILPVVKVYQWYGDEIPSLEELSSMKYMRLNAYSKAWLEDEPYYYICLESTSKRVIPKDNLYYMGNIEGDDIILKGNLSGNPNHLSWETQRSNHMLEEHIIRVIQTLTEEGLF